MLELEVDCADERKAKVERLEEIVKLRLEALSDARGAFETVAQLLVLRPDSRDYRAHFAELATQTRGEERRADVLIAVARQELPRELAAELLDEAAEVCVLALGAPQRAADLYREVLNLRADNVVAGLHAGRRLAAMSVSYTHLTLPTICSV